MNEDFEELKRKVSAAGGDVQIRPTLTCFDDALDYLTHRVKVDGVQRAFDRLRLVHGICLAPEGRHAGQPFAHGWVEEVLPTGKFLVWQDGWILDHRVQYSMDRAEFFRELRVQKVTRYNLKEAARENARTGTYGPWIPEYVTLCGGGTVFEPEASGG